jgi:hypothetical protein
MLAQNQLDHIEEGAMRHPWFWRAVGVSAMVLGEMMAGAAPATAQDQSAPLAAELVKLLDAAKATSIAAAMPGTPDQFVGALYVQGSELLVVSGRYAAPQLMTAKLNDKAYMDVYVDLNTASIPNTKVLISDLGADGLKAQRKGNEPFDTAEIRGKTVSFDGDWSKAKLSEKDYMSTFSTAEHEYAEMLRALVAQMKK